MMAPNHRYELSTEFRTPSSGVQLASMGIVGEYLGRVYHEVKMRPLYVVKCVRGRLAAERAQHERKGQE